LFASGKKDEVEIKTQNDVWVLCITNINDNSLSQEKKIIKDVILKELTERMNLISYRTRISPEYTYYEEFAWASARSVAAKALASKREERARFIFQGESGWRYRQNIKKTDDEIIKLKEDLDKIENNAPLINRHPEFKLTNGNLNNSFPDAPSEGAENRFCTNQTADAFLSGEITEFYGRYILAIRLYTLYTNSFVWEDNVIFSHDDLDSAIDEITRKLIIVLSGNEPSYIAITAEPENTLLLINRTFAGRGNVDAKEIPPGIISITATAPDHESINYETEINTEEFISFNFRLKPISYNNVNIITDKEGRIYHGALYVGDSPLSLKLPIDSLEFLEFYAINADKGTIVFQTPQINDIHSNISMRSRTPLPKGRLDSERRHFYWGWGITWLTGIAAWITTYTYNGMNYAIAYNRDIVPDKFVKQQMTMYYVSMGSIIAVGTAAAYGIYRLISYLYYANRPATSVKVPSRISSRKERRAQGTEQKSLLIPEDEEQLVIDEEQLSEELINEETDLNR